MHSFSRPCRVSPLMLVIAGLMVVSFAGLTVSARAASAAGGSETGLVNYGQPSIAVPDSYYAHRARGEELILKGDLDGAAREFMECIRLFQPYVSDRVKQGNYSDKLNMETYFLPLATACVNLGHALQQKGRLDTAIELYTGAADVGPGCVPAHESLGAALIEQGWAHHLERADLSKAVGDVAPDNYELGLYRSAIAHLHVARQLDPESATVRIALSTGLRRWGVLDGAIVQGRKAVELAPDNPDTNYTLGQALAALGQLPAAIDALREASRYATDRSDAYRAELQNALGLALDGNGEFEDALKAHQQAVALAPESAQYRNNLGAALRDAGRLDESLPALADAIVLDPGTTEHFLNLAATSRDAGKLQEAITAYRNALRLTATDAEIHHQLGVTLYRAAAPENAIATYAAATGAEPTDAAVREALATIAMHFVRERRLTLVNAMDPRAYENTPRIALSPNPWPKLTRETSNLADFLDNSPLYGTTRLQIQAMLEDAQVARAALLDNPARYLEVAEIKAAGAQIGEPLTVPQATAAGAAPRNPIADVDELTPDARRSVLGIASALRQGDDLLEAIQELKWAAKLEPKSELVANNLGKALFEAGDVNGALAMFNKSIALSPDISEAFLNRGVAQARLGQMPAAMASWDKAERLGCSSAFLHTLMAIGYIQQAEFAYAQARLDRALGLDANFAPALYYSGLLNMLGQSASPLTRSLVSEARLSTPIGKPHYSIRGEFITTEALAGGLDLMARADQADPERRAMYGYVGVELALQNPALSPTKGAVVIHGVSTHRSLEPDWAAVSNNLAVCAAVRGDLQKAEDLLRVAIADEPGYALAHWNLAQILTLNDRRSEAKREATLASKLAGKQGLSSWLIVPSPRNAKAAMIGLGSAPGTARTMPLTSARKAGMKSLPRAFDVAGYRLPK
jgi:tetratricopeptide (TPR) repeat protein